MSFCKAACSPWLQASKSCVTSKDEGTAIRALCCRRKRENGPHYTTRQAFSHTFDKPDQGSVKGVEWQIQRCIASPVVATMNSLFNSSWVFIRAARKSPR